ncbi:NAD(P)/FAD-dependent oxidoreductase [Marivirga atlantica]|uniref:Kynurenine 3-monooxygenase n=1 Tax=Marivirga atlantica TaxID=1548457 RepID=A0A937AAZ5_9BACT|nr:NAD(P)/FAD-dependent oxidoreductase [Marivirga atlantica]MBL0766870.1 FAD-dependent monooxygenase [Marivirga atlantica]
MSNKIKSIGILGAGLVGTLLSLYLKKRGYQVKVFEKRSDLRKSNNEGGRSINLALSKRGIKALEEVGVFADVKSVLIPMEGRMMHNREGNLTFQPYGKEGQHINSVSRSVLNEHLIEAAEQEGVQLCFDHTCTAVDLENTTISFEHNGKESTEHFDLVFGADGAYSQLRQAMFRTNRFNYQQFYIEHGYKELTIPPTESGDFAINPNALHIWPRGKYMLIALPNLDRSFTCTLFLPFEGDPSFETLTNKKSVQSFFEKTFADTLPLIENLDEEFFENPTSSLVTVKCYPWVKNNCVLIGDASHAIVPFYGQGMNAGFEDCFVLNKLLNEFDDNWDKTLNAYQQLRKEDGDAITDLALNNFIEMRDLVADDKFLLQKKIERHLQDAYPDKWLPLYSMVTFSDLRYSEALEIGKKQQAIMDEVMNRNDIFENWESLDFEEIVNQL